MTTRSIPFFLAMAFTSLAFGQAAKLAVGTPFSRVPKNATGDVYAVVTGTLLENGQGLLYVEDNMVPKVVALDANMNPGAELVLQNHAFDALMWNGVTGFVVDGNLHCLLHTNTKKTTEYAIAQVDSRGTPALNTLRRVASSDILFKNDPTTTLPYRPHPDPILFSQGLLFSLDERIIVSPDGEHFLLNNYTWDAKGNKRFWFSYLDKEFTELWSGTATLPYADEPSRIHQISLANDGTIHLLAYLFPCGGEERKSDKLCHELHLTTLADRGKTVTDVLVDKDFVSSARLCERDGGKVSMAIRYGSLTGQPGVVLTFDPKDPKLKTTPVVDQRIPSIKKTKLLAYGSIDPNAKKGAPARNAKVPNEIVQLLPAWDNGLVVVETFLETNFEVPVGEAIAIRRVAGDVRTSYVAANDSILWQHVAERAFMTTAGQSYDGVSVHLGAQGITLLYDHTPKGLDAIQQSGNAPEEETDGKKSKKDKPAGPRESGVLKATTLDTKGAAVAQGTALIHPEGYMPCPKGSVHAGAGKYMVKTFDRKNSYSLTFIDASAVGQ